MLLESLYSVIVVKINLTFQHISFKIHILTIDDHPIGLLQTQIFDSITNKYMKHVVKTTESYFIKALCLQIGARLLYMSLLFPRSEITKSTQKKNT